MLVYLITAWILYILANIEDSYEDARDDEGIPRDHTMELLGKIGYAFSGACFGKYCALLPIDFLTSFWHGAGVISMVIVSVALGRFAVFNWTYNTIRGLPTAYVGTTDWIDRNITARIPYSLRIPAYIASLFASFVLLLEFLR